MEQKAALAYILDVESGNQSPLHGISGDLGVAVLSYIVGPETDNGDGIDPGASFQLGTLFAAQALYNGTSFDRGASLGSDTDGQDAVRSGLAGVVARLQGFNGSSWDRLLVNPDTGALIVEAGGATDYGDDVDNVEAVETGLNAVVSRGTIFDGTDWDLVRSIDTTVVAPTWPAVVQSAGAAQYFFDQSGSAYRRVVGRNFSNDGVNMAADRSPQVINSTYLYGGDDIGLDRQRNNEYNALFASAARTTTQTTATQTNFNGRGVTLILNVTAVPGIETLTLRLNAVDPISGATINLATSAAIVATGTYILTVYPGITVAANSKINDVVPRQWNASITPSASGSFTYSLSSATIL